VDESGGSIPETQSDAIDTIIIIILPYKKLTTIDLLLYPGLGPHTDVYPSYNKD
jgi:hypothetical protein